MIPFYYTNVFVLTYTLCVCNFPSCLELLSYSHQIFTLAINDTWTLEYIVFIKVVITNVIDHWGEEWQFFCLFWELRFKSHSIRIRFWTLRSSNWKASSVQFNFLFMASKQPNGNMVELSTLTWGKKEVVGHKTSSLTNGNIMVNHIWCKVCLPTKMILWISWKEMQNRVHRLSSRERMW